MSLNDNTGTGIQSHRHSICSRLDSFWRIKKQCRNTILFVDARMKGGKLRSALSVDVVEREALKYLIGGAHCG